MTSRDEWVAKARAAAALLNAKPIPEDTIVFGPIEYALKRSGERLMPGESKLEQAFRRRCKNEGIFERKLVAPSQTGFPDRVMIYGGYVMFLEFKNPNKKGFMSAKQTNTRKAMHLAGADVREIVTYEDAKNAVDFILNR